MTQEEANTLIESVFKSFQLRWCESKSCWCMGCANRSSQLLGKGVTKAYWEEWKRSKDQSSQQKE